jgi:hypothetical protein
MAIVLIRGTGGSGKSYIAMQVIARLGGTSAGTTLPLGPKGKIGAHVWQTPPVTVVGRYEGFDCAGCDMLNGWPHAPDDVCALINAEAARGQNVLWEGITVSSYGQPRLLAMRDLTVVQLTTPVEMCLEAVRARRLAKGNAKPLDEYHTRRKHRGLYTTSKNNLKLGIKVEMHSRETALPRVMELLGL